MPTTRKNDFFLESRRSLSLHEDDHEVHVHYAFSHKLFRQDLIELDQVVLPRMFQLLVQSTTTRRINSNRILGNLLDQLDQSYLESCVNIEIAIKDRR